MAELIPLEYRVAVARKILLGRWMVAGTLVVLLAVGGLAYTYMWKRHQADACAGVQREYQKAAVLLTEARQLQTSRDALAARMARIQRIESDAVLRSLLANVAAACSEDDCLKFIRVEAHPAEAKADDAHFQVQINGFTVDDTSHSRLLDRLTDIGRRSQPPLKVNLGEKHLAPLRDGEVTSFDLTCEPLPPVASADKGH
jgi:hypothetical protein